MFSEFLGKPVRLPLLIFGNYILFALVIKPPSQAVQQSATNTSSADLAKQRKLSLRSVKRRQSHASFRLSRYAKSVRLSTIHRNVASLHRRVSAKNPLRGYCHPLNGLGYLSQGAGMGTHVKRNHYAYDLAISIGTPVYAMRSGWVINFRDRYPDTGGSRRNSTRANYALIEHSDGFRSAYLHLKQGFNRKISLRRYQWIEAGQLIGYSGNSGWTTAPHLHVEVQYPGTSSTFTQSAPYIIAGRCTPPPTLITQQAPQTPSPVNFSRFLSTSTSGGTVPD